MKYCSNCGKELIENMKFCSSCGTKIGISKNEGKKPLMYKRESKSLKDKAKDLGKDKFQKAFEKKIQDKATDFVKSKVEEGFATKNQKESHKTTYKQQTSGNQVDKNNSLNKWTWIYIIINALLVFLGSQSEDVLGVLIFSVLIIAIVFFRRKKEKPYNWLVRIIQVLQIVLLVALIAEGGIAYISVYSLVFTGLLFANVILLFKGNNS